MAEIQLTQYSHGGGGAIAPGLLSEILGKAGVVAVPGYWVRYAAEIGFMLPGEPRVEIAV